MLVCARFYVLRSRRAGRFVISPHGGRVGPTPADGDRLGGPVAMHRRRQEAHGRPPVRRVFAAAWASWQLTVPAPPRLTHAGSPREGIPRGPTHEHSRQILLIAGD
jgi:hypothetical protein